MMKPVRMDPPTPLPWRHPWMGTNWTTRHEHQGRSLVNFPLMSGITSSVTNTIYVRLSVGKNGGVAEQKTTDGNAASGSNGYQTILVTPSSM